MSFIYYILDICIFILDAEAESVVDGIPMTKLSINTEELESLFDYDEDELVVGMISEVRSFSTLPTFCIVESSIEIKINLNFIFTLLCGASKGFMKAFKAFTTKKFEYKNLS